MFGIIRSLNLELGLALGGEFFLGIRFTWLLRVKVFLLFFVKLIISFLKIVVSFWLFTVVWLVANIFFRFIRFFERVRRVCFYRFFRGVCR